MLQLSSPSLLPRGGGSWASPNCCSAQSACPAAVDKLFPPAAAPALLLQRLVDRAQTQARFSGELERLQMARDLVWGRQLNDWQIREASLRGAAGQAGAVLLPAALDHE